MQECLDFNLLDPDCFAGGHPHDAYDRLRRETPVCRQDGGDGRPPVWLLTRYDDVRAVSLDRDRFSSASGFRVYTERRAAMAPEIAEVLARFMLAMDEPEHSDFRKVVSSCFMPAALSGLEPLIRSNTAQMMAGLRDKGEMEFVSEIGAIVPIKTVCAVMGVPSEDEWRVFEFTNAVFGTDDPEYAPSLEKANEHYLAIFDYGWSMLEQRRRDPRDDLLTRIATARLPDGRALTRTEQISFFSNMIAAGNETTRSSLSGAVWSLANHPDVRQMLVADTTLIPQAVQELLRWFSPVFQMARTALCDLELGGETVRAGDKVALLYGAANHDPAVFADPHRLDIHRANANRHVTFGYGIHHCLGLRLAVMQLTILLEEFLTKYPNYKVLAEPEYIRSNFVGAMKKLRVSLDG